MIFDLFSVLFMGFMAYCMYILVIIPYQERRKKDLEVYDRYIASLEKDK